MHTYCFRASTVIYRLGRPIGKFTARDTSPEIVKHLERACAKHCKESGHGLSHTDVELIMERNACPQDGRFDIEFEFYKPDHDDTPNK